MRYHAHELRSLPIEETFGISQNDRLEDASQIHSDAVTFRKRPGRRSKPTPRPGRVETNEHDSLQYLLGRFIPFDARYDSTEPDVISSYVLWQMKYVGLHQRAFEIQVRWANRKMKKHEHMLETGSNGKTGTYRKGIEEWGAPVVKTLPDLASHGFVAKKQDKGEDSTRSSIASRFNISSRTCRSASRLRSQELSRLLVRNITASLRIGCRWWVRRRLRSCATTCSTLLRGRMACDGMCGR